MSHRGRSTARCDCSRLLGMQPLTVERLVDCHAPGGPPFPRRGVVVTADDAFRDVVEPLRRHAGVRPLLFVPTAAVGGPAGLARRRGGRELEGARRSRRVRRRARRARPDGAPAPRARRRARRGRRLRGSRDDLRPGGSASTPSHLRPTQRTHGRPRSSASPPPPRLSDRLHDTASGRNGPGFDPFVSSSRQREGPGTAGSRSRGSCSPATRPGAGRARLSSGRPAAGRLGPGCRSARDRAAAALAAKRRATTAASALKRPANGVEREDRDLERQPAGVSPCRRAVPRAPRSGGPAAVPRRGRDRVGLAPPASDRCAGGLLQHPAAPAQQRPALGGEARAAEPVARERLGDEPDP